MPTEAKSPSGQKLVTLLHRALCAGFVAVLLVFGALPHLQGAPLLADNPSQAFIGIALAALGLLPIVLVLVIFRPRVPPRPTDQSVEAYWGAPETVRPALVVWVLCEGGGMVGAVGYLLTGHLAPGITAAAGLAALVLNGPGQLAGSGR